ncbi:MAG TPA: hypothetical protein VIL29_02990 [Pseudothermotoga sp.]
MRIEGIGYVYNPYTYSKTENTSTAQTPQILNKDQMMQILNFMIYQQNGLAMKMVRITTENYVKAQMDQLA